MKNFKQITDNGYNECPINDDLETTLYVDAVRTVIKCPWSHFRAHHHPVGPSDIPDDRTLIIFMIKTSS